MTLLVAAAATLLALVPAILIGRAGVAAILGFLGIEAASLTAPWWSYLLLLAAGLILPPMLALPALVKTSRATVRAAIDHHGGGSNPSAATGVLARLGRIRRLDRDLLMALRNTIRRPARFLLSVGLLASAGMVFVAGMSLSAGTAAIGDEQKEQRNWDVEVQLARPAPVDQVTTVVGRLPDVNRVEGWSRTPSSSGPATPCNCSSVESPPGASLASPPWAGQGE